MCDFTRILGGDSRGRLGTAGLTRRILCTGKLILSYTSPDWFDLSVSSLAEEKW